MSSKFNVGDMIAYLHGDKIQEKENPIVLVIGKELSDDKRVKQYRLLVLGDMETDYNYYFGYLNSDNTYVQSIDYVDAWFKRLS